MKISLIDYKMRGILFLVLYMMFFVSFTACEEEKLTDKENDKPLQDTIHEEFVPQWNVLIDDSKKDNAFFIGTKYLGIQGWPCLAAPPHIYVGATFPESTFATSFDKEIVDEKYSIDLAFDFPIPYLTRMETVKGSEYLSTIKDAIRSEEYKSYIPPTRPYIVRFAELKSLSNLAACFPDNRNFGGTFEKIGKQTFDMKNLKSLCLGEIVFKGFSISMDIPPQGLFIDTPSNPEELVYIRTLTYGVTACFIIASENSYQDVLAAFKSSFVDDYHNPEGALHKSRIILLTVSGTDQEADIKETFDDLNTFLKAPFMDGKTYGYPIYCTGFNVRDNSVFVRRSIY